MNNLGCVKRIRLYHNAFMLCQLDPRPRRRVLIVLFLELTTNSWMRTRAARLSHLEGAHCCVVRSDAIYFPQTCAFVYEATWSCCVRGSLEYIY